MLVTWPFVLLLLDYWPLRRLLGARIADSGRSCAKNCRSSRSSAASMVVTFLAQSRGGAVRALADAPLALRVSNALVSYAKYLLATFWPLDLAVYYPFPAGRHSRRGRSSGARLLLAALTALALFQAQRDRICSSAGSGFSARSCPSSVWCRSAARPWPIATIICPSIGLFVALVFGSG